MNIPKWGDSPAERCTSSGEVGVSDERERDGRPFLLREAWDWPEKKSANDEEEGEKALSHGLLI